MTRPVRRITLIEGGLTPDAIEGDVGILLEVAPDSALRRPYPNALSLATLIGGFDVARSAAHGIAQRLLAGEPTLRGLRQLTVFEETVIGELQHALHTIHLHDLLCARGYEQCHMNANSRFADGLKHLTIARGRGPAVVQPSVRHGKLSRLRRSLARLHDAGFDRDSMRSEWYQALETLDPFGRRHLPRRSAAQWSKGELWFYTTAQTFTNAALLYEPYFPHPFRYLVDNPLTGGRPLATRGTSAVDWHAFASRRFIPSAAELEAARTTIRAHLRGVPLDEPDRTARDLLLNGHYFNDVFLMRLLPKGLMLTRTLDHWAEQVEPRAVIGGNTVVEAYALEAARRRGIPAIVLQHGLFLDYCQFLDPPADHYFVRGTFWRDFLAPSVRPKAMVLDPPSGARAAPAPACERDRECGSIVFISQPFVMPFCHEVELDDLIPALIACAADTGAELCIRVHPMESLAAYRRRTEAAARRIGRQVDITFSQGAGLDDVLSRAAVAITSFSTVFQDCLRHRVPVVSLDWHDFACKRQMAASRAFVFAGSLAELQRLVRDGVAGKLDGDACELAPFLASTPEIELRRAIAHVLDGSRERPHATAA